MEKNLESLQEQTQPLIEKKEKFQNDLLGYQTKVDECKAALTVSSNELKIVQHSETSERQKYNTWKDSLEDSKKEFDEKKTQLKELQSNLPEVKQSAVNYRQQLEDRVKEENELTQQLLRLRADVDEKTRAMKAAQSNNKIVDALMKLRINGTKGFEGVMGRLVSRALQIPPGRSFRILNFTFAIRVIWVASTSNMTSPSQRAVDDWRIWLWIPLTRLRDA